MTAFYMFRLYYLIFWWKEHKIHAGHHAPHDQAWTMTLPLVILAAVTCVAGFIPFGNLVSWNGEPYDFMAHFDWSIAAVSLIVALVGIGLATVMYRKENPMPAKMRNALPLCGTGVSIASTGTSCICSSPIRSYSMASVSLSLGLTVALLTVPWTVWHTSPTRLLGPYVASRAAMFKLTCGYICLEHCCWAPSPQYA